MSKSILKALATCCCIIFSLSISACGGGNTPADNASVSGLATASSVTAVSATN